MKVKLKDKNLNLPNCWKQCGVNKEDWDKLQEGNEIDIKFISNSIKHLIEENISTSVKKNKGDK